MDASVSEIHHHPLRRSGFAEPLFLGRATKKEIAEHLRESSSWLGKASKAEKPNEQPCHVLRRPGGATYLVRPNSGYLARRLALQGRRPSFAKRRVARVLGRWREVRGWWEHDKAERRVNRLVFRLLLSGGVVVDVALERTTGEWFWIGTLD